MSDPEWAAADSDCLSSLLETAEPNTRQDMFHAYQMKILE